MEFISSHEKRIRAQAAKGSLSHAWLVVGGAQEERAELARFIVSALLCPSEAPPCGECQHCRKLAKGIHPDLIRVEKQGDKRELVVGQIREIVRDAYVMPNEAPRKVYLIEDAEDMNAAAQNALLKILEEPPARSAFILTAQNPSAILDTVRSRCTELFSGDSELSAVEENYSLPIAEAFRARDELALASAAFALEKTKLDRESFDEVLSSLSLIFAQFAEKSASREERTRLYAAIDCADELLSRRVSNNTGAAHTAGALAVRLNRLNRPV